MNSYKTFGDLTFKRESISYAVDWTSTLFSEQSTTGQDKDGENATDENCFRCGSPGHIRKHCKVKSERQRRRDSDRLRNFLKRKRTKSRELKAVRRKEAETSRVTESVYVKDDDTLQQQKSEEDNASMVILTGSSECKGDKGNFLSNIKTLVGKKRQKSQTQLDSEANRTVLSKKVKKDKPDSNPLNLLNSDFAKRFFRTKNASCVELNTADDKHLNTENQRKSQTSASGTLPTRSILTLDKSRHADCYIEGINRQQTDDEQRTIKQLKKEIAVLFIELQEMVKNI
ncbi:Hypothetical predicted protein [Mytilus galloprovincialis]|uniref:CCHC-type domain-containing protein n=1 Tax=Mytilus galloprovincialis TaxID=29158 RepID=A0A8B6CW61_MYTGA|nr:Hypothetical predicted protein [Mytilus galloprovincialis]